MKQESEFPRRQYKQFLNANQPFANPPAMKSQPFCFCHDTLRQGPKSVFTKNNKSMKIPSTVCAGFLRQSITDAHFQLSQHASKNDLSLLPEKYKLSLVK